MSDEAATTASVMDGLQSEKDYLAEFVGEGKKYATVEEAAKALAKKAVHADQFIETMKNEKTALAERLRELEASQKTAEEIVELITLSSASNSNPSEHKQTAPLNQGIDPESIKNLVEQKFAEKSKQEAMRIQRENLWTKLRNEFGDDEAVKGVLLNYAGDNPDKRAAVDKLGFTDPDGLITLLKSASVHKETFSKERTGERVGTDPIKTDLTWSKAKEIKRTNPTMYSSLAFQRQLQEAVGRNPDFYKR